MSPPVALSPAHDHRVQRWISALTARPLFWIAVVLLVASWPLGRAVLIRLPPVLPILGKFPDFALIDQTGERFGAESVRGRVWVGGVVSTTDPDADVAVGRLRTIQHRAHNLGTSFRVVCFTRDPERDTPVKLAEFIRGRHTSPRMWSFLTGPREELEPVLGHFDAPPAARAFILLVDTELRIRARYRADEPDVVEKVLRDVGLLANRGG
jgi:protein SCO1/2